MKSMMFIAGQYYAARPTSAPAFDARAATGADDRGMHGAGRQDHAIPRLQLDPAGLGVEHERDRSAGAVEDLLVRVAVGRIPVPRAVRPRVAAARLGAKPLHQVFLRA